MAQTITLTLNIPQPTVKVAVEFYDDAERRKLHQYPTYAVMENLVKAGLEIPTEEFLTYYLFHKKRPGKEGWRSYAEVGRKIANALLELSEWVDFNGESISTPSNLAGQDPTITERIGESIGLSVVSQIHGLTAADWDGIPTGPHKSFDYQVASDGKHVIQMEAKGSAAEDNTAKTSSVSQHKKNISDKKKAIAELESENNYPYPANLRYGTITVMGESVNEPVRCLLVDPPAEGDGAVARRFQLLQRMRFLRDWVSFISPRSQLASAMQTRLAAMERLPDPLFLDGVPLLKGNGQRFDFTPIGGMFGGHASFFGRKSKITDGPAGGIVTSLPNGDLLFLGIRETLLEQTASQDFRRLTEYKAEHGPVRKTVECVLADKAFSELHLPSRITNAAQQHDGYSTFEATGQIHYSDTGILFGVLPIHDEQE
jgi:hypothetical protein